MKADKKHKRNVKNDGQPTRYSDSGRVAKAYAGFRRHCSPSAARRFDQSCGNLLQRVKSRVNFNDFILISFKKAERDQAAGACEPERATGLQFAEPENDGDDDEEMTGKSG